MSKSNRTSSECKICSAATFSSYYGAKACEPCKVFFRRNAKNRKKILKCALDGQCQVNIDNRHNCSACRLEKCFKVGMCSEMIRTPRTKKMNNVTASVQMTSRENKQPQRLTTLNLLEQDQSYLSTDEWTLISNMINSYDEHSALLIAKDFIKELESLHPKLRFKIDSKKIVEIVTIFYQATEPFIQSNHDFASLPLHDRSIVLRGAVDNVSCLGGGLIMRQSGLITNLAFRQGLENTFGTVPYNLALILISLLDQDINLVKLTLSLFAFCTSSCTLFDENTSSIYIIDHQAFLRIQNMYAEVIWKYLRYKYTFHQAVLRFSRLVQCLVAALTVRTHLQTVRNHTDVVYALIQKIERQQNK